MAPAVPLKGSRACLRRRCPTRRSSSASPRRHSSSAVGSSRCAIPTDRPPHLMQGWTPDFIPKLTADAVAMKVIDRIITVPGSEAIHYAGELARREGIFVGITGGATFAGALRVCAEAPTGANILAMLPDTGERYLSTPLFANVPADMTPEELDISRSTPSAQFSS